MSFDKAEQLIALARKAAAGRQGLTLDDVKEAYGVSLRTAQRMFRALEANFPQTESYMGGDGRKRWRLPSGRHNEFFSLTAEEVASLDLGAAHLERAGLQLEARALTGLREKILALLPANQIMRLEPDADAILEAQGFVARPGPRPRVDEQVALAVSEAIKACRLLEMGYRSHADDKPSLRRVAPYGLLSGYRRYLVALDPDSRRKGAIKTYRMDSISEARVLNEYFERLADFDLQAFANRGFALYQNDSEYGEVQWRFAPEAAETVRGTLFHPCQQTQECADGSILVSFMAAGHLEMAWYLYQWGDKVEVVKPLALREMVKGHQRGDFPVLP